MSDQAIGFLLEFRNEASADLKAATTDFDKATEALENAVDAAQAAFTFLEEGTASFAKSIGGAVKDVTGKAGELQTAMGELGSVEISAPDMDPIEDAMNNLGANIAAPFESGIEEMGDAVEDFNDNIKDIHIPVAEIVAAYQAIETESVSAMEEVVKETQHVESASADYVRTLNGMSNAALESRSSLRKQFEGLDSSLAKTGRILFKETIPGLEEFGEKGKEAAAAIAGDTVEAYQRLQGAAGEFFTENREAFAKAKDASEVWKGFIEAEDSDVAKVQDLLRIADEATLKPLVQGLVDELGDAALAEEFWGPIADNKNVDREFFTDLRKQFLKENKTYKTWWDKMGSTAQKFFWPVFKKQGEKASGGIASFLGQKMKAVFSSPIGQFTAALQLSNLITRVFGPALDVFAEIIGQTLLPVMRLLIDFMEDLQPILLAVMRAVFPLFEALALLAGEILKGILPVVQVFVDVLLLMTPIIITVAETVGGVLNFVFSSLGDTLKWVGGLLEFVSGILSKLLSVVLFILKPVIDLIVFLDKWTGASKALGFVISVFLLPVMWTMATTLIPKMIAGIWSMVTAEGSLIGTIWGHISANAVLLWSTTKDSASKVWNTAVTWWNSESVIANTIAKGFNTIATWAATAAAWAFNSALLANPITWIVLGIAAAIAVLVAAVWLLWEPIVDIFDFFADMFKPLLGWVENITGWFGDWGNAILSVLDPLGLLTGALDIIVGLFDWIFGTGDESENTFSLGWITDGIDWLTDWVFVWFDMLPDWIKWLFGIDDAETPEDAGPSEQAGIQDAKAMVEGSQEGAEIEASEQPDWWKSMWGIDAEESASTVADSAAENYKSVGAAATDVLFGLATMFPLGPALDVMFGPFASILGVGSPEQVQTPALSGVNVGEVDYSVDSDISSGEINLPIVDAIDRQTVRLMAAIANSGSSELDLDLSELKDIAGFN